MNTHLEDVSPLKEGQVGKKTQADVLAELAGRDGSVLETGEQPSLIEAPIPTHIDHPIRGPGVLPRHRLSVVTKFLSLALTCKLLLQTVGHPKFAAI